MQIEAVPLTDDRKNWADQIFTDWNQAKGFTEKPETFCFECTDENGQRTGLVHGKFFGGWCGVTDLVVAPLARGSGVGRHLMRVVEEEAQNRKCVGMYLTTLSFQAPEFYIKLGYTCFAQLDEFAGSGNKRYYFKKEF